MIFIRLYSTLSELTQMLDRELPSKKCDNCTLARGKYEYYQGFADNLYNDGKSWWCYLLGVCISERCCNKEIILKRIMELL